MNFHCRVVPCQEVHAEATGELGEQVSNLFHQNSSVSADSNISIIEELQNPEFRLARHSRYTTDFHAGLAFTATVRLSRCLPDNCGHGSQLVFEKRLSPQGTPLHTFLLQFLAPREDSAGLFKPIFRVSLGQMLHAGSFLDRQ